MKNLADFSPDQFEDALEDILASRIKCLTVKGDTAPEAILLGGQSGAGKTTLHKIFKARFADDVAIINGDEYRSYHPHYHELFEEYGSDSVKYTASWAGKMTEALIDSLSSMGYNLVIEGTLRTSEVPLKTAKLLRCKGYDVSLALMAVKPEISLVSCQIRYELMRLAGTTPRATDPAHHRLIVESIVGNLSVLEESGLFSSVSLYSRSGECLYSSQGKEGSASAALKEALFGSWTAEELFHYEYLCKRLESLKEGDAN